ncbi:MAG: hypothetical protein WD512_12565 [Candidatus Paceibacterota bacterium]
MNDFEGLKELLDQKQAAIKKRTTTGIHEESNFKRLLAACNSYRDKRPHTGIISLIMSVESIKISHSSSVETLYSSLDECVHKACNHVSIDEEFNFTSSEKIHTSNSNEIKEVYRELSKDGYCVIVIGAELTSYLIDGDFVGEAIFFTKEDLESFEKRKDVTDLIELFEDYRKHVKIRPVYQNFFVSNSGKKALFSHLINDGQMPDPGNKDNYKKSEKEFLDKYKNLLENKPEDRFRENLRKYLEANLKGTISVTKEHILENFKRIDIFINDEFGDLYLIEVKWIGLSIHASGKKLGTEYNPSDINPEAIKQTILYLSELFENKKDIKIGYLVVFDAREGETEDSVPNFNELSFPDQLEKFSYRFKKIPDIKVLNKHPN